MAALKKLSLTVVAALVVVFGLYFIVTNWGYVFSETVDGEIIGVERVTPPVAIVGQGTTTGSAVSAGMFSFSVAIRDNKGIIHTASSEDRQWAIAKPGFCVTSVFYPYAPWHLKKDGTYTDARLVQLRDCQPIDRASGAAGKQINPVPAATSPAEPSSSEQVPTAASPAQ